MPARLLLLLLPFLFEWVKRKFDARVERRVGPPFLQPFYDFIKLFHKKTIKPENVNMMFTLGPILFTVFSLFALFIIWELPQFTLVYLLAIFTLITFLKILMANSVKSQFTILGAGRLASLKLALDPAFSLAFLAPAFLWGFGMNWSITAIVFLPLAILVALAELELSPFDHSHAKTEIAAGWKTEFSGKSLALLNYSEHLKFVIVSLMLATMLGPLYRLWKAFGIFIILISLSIGFPRMRLIDAIKFLSFINLLIMLEVILSLNLAYLLG